MARISTTTFEGGPVHARRGESCRRLLAACERHNPDGRMALIRIAVGTEVLCRLSLVVPKAVHKAGFHPTAVFGAMGAAPVWGCLGLNAKQIVDALGVAGAWPEDHRISAEGAWTKRLHAGWAGAIRIRAAVAGAGRVRWPRIPCRGVHGLFHGSGAIPPTRLRRSDG